MENCVAFQRRRAFILAFFLAGGIYPLGDIWLGLLLQMFKTKTTMRCFRVDAFSRGNPNLLRMSSTSRSSFIESLFYMDHHVIGMDLLKTRKMWVGRAVAVNSEDLYMPEPDNSKKTDQYSDLKLKPRTMSDLDEAVEEIVQISKETYKWHNTMANMQDRGIYEVRQRLLGTIAYLRKEICDCQSLPDMTVFSLADALISFFHLVSIGEFSTQTRLSVTEEAPLQAFFLILWSQLEHRQGDQYLDPKRWMDCLKAYNVLELDEVTETVALYSRICHRLTQGDALSRLHPNQLVQGLQLFASDHRRKKNTVEANKSYFNQTFHPRHYLQPCEETLVQAIARRLRKQAVRDKMSDPVLMRAIQSSCNLLENIRKNRKVSKLGSQMRNNDIRTGYETSQSLIGEIEKLAYTLTKERLDRMVAVEGVPTISFHDMATLFSCARLVVTENTSPIVEELCAGLEKSTSFRLGMNSAKNSFSQAHLFADASSVMAALAQWKKPEARLQLLGTALLYHDQQAHATFTIDQLYSVHVNTIFRSFCLIYGKSCREEVVAPFRALAERLISDSYFIVNTPTDWSALSNLLWFSSMYGLSTAAMEQLGHDLLKVVEVEDKRRLCHDSIGQQYQVMHQCSPRLACRILSSYTAHAVNSECWPSKEDTVPLSYRDLLFKIFEQMGEKLLSTQLETIDISNALVAYAKAGYTRDPGIIDHLAGSLVRQLEEASTRQVTQSLWACAKLSELDDIRNQEVCREESCLARESLKGTDCNCITYLSYGMQMALFLSENASDLSTKDVAQLVWALAKLNISVNSKMLEPILARTSVAVSNLNAQETANCLWGLSRLKRNAYGIIFKLTKRLREKELVHSLKPQEAISVLFSLGSLNIRDEDLFGDMSKLIINNIDKPVKNSSMSGYKLSPSAVAQVLWAHRQVHLQAPKEILHYRTHKELS